MLKQNRTFLQAVKGPSCYRINSSLLSKH